MRADVTYKSIPAVACTPEQNNTSTDLNALFWTSALKASLLEVVLIVIETVVIVVALDSSIRISLLVSNSPGCHCLFAFFLPFPLPAAATAGAATGAVDEAAATGAAAGVAVAAPFSASLPLPFAPALPPPKEFVLQFDLHLADFGR